MYGGGGGGDGGGGVIEIETPGRVSDLLTESMYGFLAAVEEHVAELVGDACHCDKQRCMSSLCYYYGL